MVARHYPLDVYNYSTVIVYVTFNDQNEVGAVAAWWYVIVIKSKSGKLNYFAWNITWTLYKLISSGNKPVSGGVGWRADLPYITADFSSTFVCHQWQSRYIFCNIFFCTQKANFASIKLPSCRYNKASLH